MPRAHGTNSGREGAGLTILGRIRKCLRTKRVAVRASQERHAQIAAPTQTSYISSVHLTVAITFRIEVPLLVWLRPVTVIANSSVPL